jgi:hypothetical protein
MMAIKNLEPMIRASRVKVAVRKAKFGQPVFFERVRTFC